MKLLDLSSVGSPTFYRKYNTQNVLVPPPSPPYTGDEKKKAQDLDEALERVTTVHTHTRPFSQRWRLGINAGVAHNTSYGSVPFT